MNYIHQILIIILLLASQVVCAGNNAGSKISKNEFQTLALKHNFAHSENKTLWLDKNIQQKNQSDPGSQLPQITPSI